MGPASYHRLRRAIVSIAHRISSVPLFLALLSLALGLGVSLRGETQFEALRGLLPALWRIVPGAALPAAQVVRLSIDIVWLVDETVALPDGSTQRVRASLPPHARP